MNRASREKDEASRKNVSYRIVVATRAAVRFPVHALRLALIFAGRTRALTP